MMISNWNSYYNEQCNYSTHKYFTNYVSTIPCTILELLQNTQIEQHTVRTPANNAHLETEP